jgi:hypothetical protein
VRLTGTKKVESNTKKIYEIVIGTIGQKKIFSGQLTQKTGQKSDWHKKNK